MLDVRREKLVDGAESAARQDEFPAYLQITAAHVAKQLNLLVGTRRKVGVTPLRRCDPVALAIPYEKGLAKTRTRGNQRAGSAGFGFSGIQHAKFFLRKVLDAVPRRAQIIQ